MTNQHGVPGIATSYWLTAVPASEYPSLEGEFAVDVVVVGGGAAGIMSAVTLKEAGLTVALVEARRLLGGATGSTTAKITSLHRLVYHRLVDRFGKEKARQYAASNEAAIDRIAGLVEERAIDCDFARLPFYTYTRSDESLALVENEARAAEQIGLPASFTSEVPLPLETRGAVRLENQARFHPVKFMEALAASIPGHGCHIFENSRVMHLEHGRPCEAITDGGRIKAKSAVVATNFPVFDKEGLYFARLRASRSYAIAVRAGGPFPDGMFIDAEESGLAWRAQPDAGGELTIISGGGHATGHGGDTREHYRELERAARERLGDVSIEYSWSTQDAMPYDGVPCIGRLSPLHDNLFVATGFGKWGMTTSVVAGIILADMIRGVSNPWAEVYNPLRFNPGASGAKTLISQNAHTVEMFVSEHLAGAPDISQLATGSGQVVREKGDRLAAYRDDQGRLVRLNPNCTHMGCIVHWNAAERSWDCPCHGSRFTCDGEVITGPAIEDLEQKK